MSSNNYDSQASTNYKEAFALFDKRGNGRVTVADLGDLLRACGQNPTLSEIQDLEKNVNGDCKPLRPLDFPSSAEEYELTGRSRLRDVLPRSQPPRWLPRSRRARGVLPRLPGV